MEISKRLFFAKGQTIKALLILFAMLIMVFPVFANTSGWSFTGTVAGRVVNGGNNGIYHNMTAGSLTNSGSIWPTFANPGSTSPSPWVFEVWKDNGIFDSFICASSPVTTGTTIGQGTSFSQGCGTISSGSYYLVAWRATTDGRSYSASGSFSS
ncbi:MAG: hypothetical protein SFZ02_00920 [bacterium]|nr:hypothetical protein [bacterium]